MDMQLRGFIQCFFLYGDQYNDSLGYIFQDEKLHISSISGM